MDNYFDPIASPTLGEEDPLRTWAQQLQNDPELPKLMATDPQGAIDRMAKMGIPPPPPHIMSFTDGVDASNAPPSPPSLRMPFEKPGGMVPSQTIGGAVPQYSDPVGAGAFDPQMPVFGPDGKMMGNQTSAQGQPPVAAADAIPLPTPDPRKSLADSLDPTPAPAEAVPLPVPRPAEAGPGASDISASKKKKEDAGDALGGFAKSLQGVKPIAPPAPNFVGTPSVRAHGNIAAPNLQNLLSMVGQPGPSPLALTLGRLLATGKA